MGMMTRFIRMWKADIHGVMDQLEDKGLLLKQSLRDMEEELERKEARFRKMTAARNRLAGEHEKCGRECEKLEQDLAVALKKNRDDIARMLIKKLKTLSSHREALQNHIKTMEDDIIQFRGRVEEQRLQYERFHLRSEEYFHRAERRQWEEATAAVFPYAEAPEPSAEEIELELLRRKESIQTDGGGNK